MTTEKYIADLRARLKQLDLGKAFGIAVASTHAKMVTRIFEDGENQKGGKIGQYSTSPEIYVNPKTSPKSFPVKGKTGKTKFKNGKPYKTGFFESYKAFRQKIGRETAFVNLRLSGQLMKDFTNSIQKLTPLRYITGVKNKKNGDKIEGNEERYGRIFAVQKDEKALLLKVLRDERIRLQI